MLTSMEPMKSFSRSRPKIQFDIDGDVFTAAPGLPAGTLAEFGIRYADAVSDSGIKQQYDSLSAVIRLVLLPESYERFTARMTDSERPIDLEQLNEVIVWLLEQYGLRPTGPSSVSSNGSPALGPGTSSTDGAQAAGSTPSS